MKEKIVITGKGIVSPFGCCEQNFITNIKNKTANFITKEEQGEKIYKNADFDINKHYDKKKIKRISKLAKAVLFSIAEAMENAKISQANPDQTGLFFGTGLGELNTTQKYLDSYLKKGIDYVSPMHFSSSVHNSPAGHTSIQKQLTGMNLTFSHKDISFETALKSAVVNLKLGKIKYALVCGADENIEILRQSYKILGMSGFKLFEGATCFVLETETGAKEKNKKILGQVNLITGNIPANPFNFPKNIHIDIPKNFINRADVIFTGENGYDKKDKAEQMFYNYITTKTGINIPAIKDKAMDYDFNTASATRLYVALAVIKGSLMPDEIHENTCIEGAINKIIIQNISGAGSYSLVSVSGV